MRTLTIRWQRLVDERGRTCPRCGATGDNVQNYAAVPTRLIVRAGERAARSLRSRSRPETRR